MNMIKVTDTVLELIESDELALETARAGLLNLSAYADKILPQVENSAKKPVKKGTIVVALSRIIKNNHSSVASLKPDIQLSDLSIKSSLCALTYEKTADLQRRIAVLHPFQISITDLLTITEGPTEITLIVSDKAKEKIMKQMRVKPKQETDNLVAVTAAYNKEFTNLPNLHFVLLSALAAKRIQIIEIISTFTETTFIVKKEDMEQTLKALNFYFNRQ